jgi:ABC-type transporter Mla MlaB component
VGFLEGSPTGATGAGWPPAVEGELTLILIGPKTPAGIARLSQRAGRLLEESGAELVTLDLRTIADPDAVTIDALARLQLTVRRSGRRVRFRHACREIHQLVDLMGLTGVLRLDTGSRIEPSREAEEREQAPGVQEERDP